MRSESDASVASHAKKLAAGPAAICRLLRKEIAAALPKARSKIWHTMPVWFVDENPVVGYKASAKQVTLLFWNGKTFGDAALMPVGKFKAAQIQFADVSEIDAKSLRRWLKRAAADIWDYQAHFKKHKALQMATRAKA